MLLQCSQKLSLLYSCAPAILGQQIYSASERPNYSAPFCTVCTSSSWTLSRDDFVIKPRRGLERTNKQTNKRPVLYTVLGQVEKGSTLEIHWQRQGFVTWAQDEDVDKYFGKKHCVDLWPTWFEIHVVSYCSKFAVKVDLSSGGCQKLPNWVKIIHLNADLLQLVRKIFCSKSWRKKITTYFSVLCNFKCIWA